MNTSKELRGIKKQFKELFGDNDCSGNYICNHESLDKHWVIYEDDTQALLNYISMTISDLEKWHTQQLNTAVVEARIDERQSMNFHRAYGKDYQYTLELLEEQNDARIATLKQQLKEGK